MRFGRYVVVHDSLCFSSADDLNMQWGRQQLYKSTQAVAIKEHVKFQQQVISLVPFILNASVLARHVAM